MKERKFEGIILAMILIVVDQITKDLAVSNLKGKPDIPIIKNVFELHYLENGGAAFGSMQGMQLLLQAITVLVMIFIIIAYEKMPRTKRFMPLRATALFLFIGAVGNMIDRVSQGYVVDFLYFKLINFPVFNVADCYVTCAAFVLAFLVIFVYTEDELSFIFKKKSDKKKSGDK